MVWDGFGWFVFWGGWFGEDEDEEEENEDDEELEVDARRRSRDDDQGREGWRSTYVRRVRRGRWRRKQTRDEWNIWIPQ